MCCVGLFSTLWDSAITPTFIFNGLVVGLITILLVYCIIFWITIVLMMKDFVVVFSSCVITWNFINGWYYILANIHSSDMAITFITWGLNMGITIMCLLCVNFIMDWDLYSCIISILVIIFWTM